MGDWIRSAKTLALRADGGCCCCRCCCAYESESYECVGLYPYGCCCKVADILLIVAAFAAAAAPPSGSFNCDCAGDEKLMSLMSEPRSSSATAAAAEVVLKFDDIVGNLRG